MKHKKKLNTIKTIVSPAVAVLIIAYLLYRADINKFLEALSKANLEFFIPLMVLFIIIWFFIESFNMMRLFKSFGHDATFRSSMDVRGITYLLLVINYNLGIAGTVYYIKKKIGVSLKRSGSLTLFYLFTETVGLSSLVLVSYLLGDTKNNAVSNIFLICSVIFFAYVAGIVIIQQKIKPVKWILKKFTVLNIFQEAGTKTIIELVFIRGFYFFSFIVFFHFSLKAFSIDIPFPALAVYIPVIFYIGTLPITPFGIGTIQAAMIFFFNEYSTEANILAFSIVYTTSLIVMRLPVGLYYFLKENYQDEEKSEMITLPDSEQG